MSVRTRRRIPLVIAATAALTMGLTACGEDEGSDDAAAAQEETSAEEEPSESGSADDAEDSESGTVEVQDNHGTQEVTTPPQNVVATDNRVFETLSDWGVELVAAPKGLVPEGVDYKTDESITDLGMHREPDLEAVVAAEPGLIVNGQRFAQYYQDFSELAPDATILELDPREDEAFDEELIRQTQALGQVFGQEDEADQLIADFEESITRVEEAYDSEQTVMSVITSGGEINYAAPGDGRTLGPVYEILGLTPALDAEDSSGSDKGDDISVEAIAESNPDWILAMDRDAAVSVNTGEEYTPANELLADSAALQNVTAVQEDNIVYMPQDTYLNEGIQTYTEFFNSVADAMEQD